jgi:hypothetical protein
MSGLGKPMFYYYKGTKMFFGEGVGLLQKMNIQVNILPKLRMAGGGNSLSQSEK